MTAGARATGPAGGQGHGARATGPGPRGQGHGARATGPGAFELLHQLLGLSTLTLLAFELLDQVLDQLLYSPLPPALLAFELLDRY